MGGGALYAPPSLFLCLLLKISWDNPYLKTLDLANLFVADVPMKKKIKKFGPPPPQSTLKYWAKIRPCQRGLRKKVIWTMCILGRTFKLFEELNLTSLPLPNPIRVKRASHVPFSSCSLMSMFYLYIYLCFMEKVLLLITFFYFNRLNAQF